MDLSRAVRDGKDLNMLRNHTARARHPSKDGSKSLARHEATDAANHLSQKC